jgi:GH25 family lysozyme M1 (1,4-beta-N-acetylmuramidase)
MLGLQSASASSTLTLNIKKTPSIGEPKVTLYGVLKPARAGLQIRIETKINGKWTRTSIGAKSKASGTWKVEVISTILAGSATYRAIANVNGRNIYSNLRSLNIDLGSVITTADPSLLISLSGPGSRIHGVDISKWQHPGNKPIDFTKMFDAGVRFVMIKASDGRDSSDVDARKWLAQDMDAAQAAGLYTGFYHYAYLPNSTDEASVITEAQTQAQKAIWRLASVGGYNDKTLPYALDLENNCIQPNGSSCSRYASKNLVTLFATTWLRTVKEKTGRTPMIYSYSLFLENSLLRTEELRSYPLWLAHYGVNPADPLGQPGQKLSGCFVHAWTSSNCSSQWVIWQYSSCGIGSKYGVPSSRLDLNVFRGDVNSFVQLTKGTWIPEVTDMMPINEPTTMQLLNSTFSTTDKPAIFQVSALRPSLLPVVTGTVKLELTDPNILLNQSVVRSKNGTFTLTVKGIPVGIWDALVKFEDQSGTHASNAVPIQILMAQGVKPTSTPTPSAKPGTSTKTPVDSCKNQIVN